MRVLLTGASGFVGRNVLRQAPQDWQVTAVYSADETLPAFVRDARLSNVVPVRCDLQSADEVANLTLTHGREWDCCLHLAAKVDIPWSVRHPQDDLRANTMPLLNVATACAIDRLVYFSSGAVYEGLSGEVTPTAPIAPTLPYAVSKLAAERYVEYAQRRCGSVNRYVIVRFFGAYGPYEAPHKIYTRLIRQFALERKRTYTIYGDGTNLIDAMYIDDAIEATLRIVRGDHWNRIVNLAGGRPLTIARLVEEVASVLGAEPVEIQMSGVANERNDFWGSVADMRDLYKFSPRVSLADGIRRFADYLSEHPHVV
jgi:UDP-glucose 4-epimerase